jgi:acetyl esterase/lipase
MNVRLALIGLLIALGGAVPASAGEIIPDVVYGHKDGMALTFDVIKPERNANGAALLFMVSGGWVSSYVAPAQMAKRFSGILDRGFTLVAVRHGSSPKYLIPEIVADVRRAVRLVRHRAKDWGIDADRLGVFGMSAGGHLSLMLGTTSDAGDPGAPEDFMRESNRVASVVAYFPPVDLRSWARGVVPAGQGNRRFPALNFEKEKAPDYSPLVHVSPDDPPTLLLHGDKDELVPIDHSQRMYAALQQAGVDSNFITFPAAEHGFMGEDATRATAALVAWFERTLLSSAAQRKSR